MQYAPFILAGMITVNPFLAVPSFRNSLPYLRTYH